MANRICPYSQRAHLALLNANMDFTYESINFITKPDWFSSLTPFNAIPLVIDNGSFIYESTAIVEYIDEKHDLGWMGSNLQHRSLLRSWFVNCNKIHNELRNFFITNEEFKFNSSLMALSNYYNNCEQHLSPHFFFIQGGEADKSLSALGIVFAPLFVLQETLAEYSGVDFWEGAKSFQRLAQEILALPNVGVLNSAEYKQELINFILPTRSVFAQIAGSSKLCV